MLDINFIRENQDFARNALKKRKVDVNVDELLKIDEERRKLIGQVEGLRKERNFLSKQGKEGNFARAKEIKKEISKIEPILKKTSEKLEQILFTLPNFPDPEVPSGESEKDNKIIRKWGEPRIFDFQFRDHEAIGKDLDIIDIERGSKVSGTGFYYLKNKGALLEMALMNYAINKACEKGFQFLLTPDLVKKQAMIGTGFFPADENEVYKIDKDGLYLIGTAEVPLASYRSGEIIKEEELPLYYAGFSSCFRREAGAYGKETKGVFRMHQFNKVEMFVICRPEEAKKEHERILGISEEIMQELKIPYEIVLNCLGDLGFPNQKRYDLNAWMPFWNGYRETHSASNDGDFQTRRLGLRYRTKTGDIQFCHTLNNTTIASPRILIAILENYQEKDGSVKIPEVLHPYLKFKEIRKRT